MIKNWVVKTKQIKKSHKGLQNYINYLKNDRSVSHSLTKIENVFESKPLAFDLLDAVDERQQERRSKGLRGGGVSNHATSFVISCPPGVHPTSKNWEKVAGVVLKDLAKHLQIKPDTLARHSFLNIHNESESGKNSHLNVVVSNVIDKKHRKDLTQFGATYQVKKSVNKAFKRYLGLDNKKYIARDKWKKGKNKPLWAARLDNAKHDIIKMIKSQNSKNKADFEKSVESMMERLSSYLDSVKKPNLLARMFTNSDKRQIKIDHQKELLTQSLIDLESDEMVEKVLDEAERVENEFEVCSPDQLKQSKDRIVAEREKKKKLKQEREEKEQKEAAKKAFKAVKGKKSKSRKGRNKNRRKRNTDKKKQP